eukprot:10638125-Alexandrium_andersonii.AAC.1
MGAAAKERCQRIVCPSTQDSVALEWFARCVARWPRVVYRFLRQAASAGPSVYVGTDFAGCVLTQRSTSGGARLRGGHLIKHWPSAQKISVASSGEATLARIAKGAVENVGHGRSGPGPWLQHALDVVGR